MAETPQTSNSPKTNPFEKWTVPLSSEQERVAIETLLAQIPFQPDQEAALLQKAVEETQRCAYRFAQERNMLASGFFQKWHDSLEKKLTRKQSV